MIEAFLGNIDKNEKERLVTELKGVYLKNN
jgi:hypothetical protein